MGKSVGCMKIMYIKGGFENFLFGLFGAIEVDSR